MYCVITGTTEARVWILERRVFQQIMISNGRQEQEDNLRFLASIPLMEGVQSIVLEKISEFLKRVSMNFHNDMFF